MNGSQGPLAAFGRGCDAARWLLKNPRPNRTGVLYRMGGTVRYNEPA
jgi:hypothetical protein